MEALLSETVLNYHVTALLQLDNAFWLVFRGLVSPDCLAMLNDTKPIKLTRVFDEVQINY
jgi:hypothetical protein